MITGDHKKLDPIAAGNVCSECGSGLSVVWDGTGGEYAIRCADGHYPSAVKRAKTRDEEYRSSSSVPVVQTFNGVPAADLGTGELLAPQVVKGLAAYAFKYNLDPGRGHVVLMYSQPYITLDGYLYHAAKTGVPFNLASRPLTDLERKQYKIGEDDHAWVCEIERLDKGSTLVGQGIVTADEVKAKSTRSPGKLRSPVVAAHPWQLAQKRAEWQALRRAFPIGASPAEEETEPCKST